MWSRSCTAAVVFPLFVSISVSFAEDSPEEKPRVNEKRVAELTEVIDAKPNDSAGYRERAFEYAWGKVATDYTKMSVLRGGNSQIAQQIGIFLVLGKDTKLHQTLYKEMTAAFAKNKNAGDLERTVKICTLTAKPVGKLDDLLKLSEQSVALGKENEFAAHHYRTLALVHVRMKQYDKALETVRLADKAEDDSRLQLPDVLICNRAIEAMCLVATGKTDEAKKALAKATPVLTKKLSNQTLLYRGDYWHDWLTAKVLHDEALGVVMKVGK